MIDIAQLRTSRVLQLSLCLAALWTFMLAVQGGNPYDEAEHAHAAWLMGKLGQQPLKDFFQHHMPLLWNVLKLYFLAGFDGPEVLLFGRLLVVLSALTLVAGWFTLARMLAPGGERRMLAVEFGGAIGLSCFVVLSLCGIRAIVIRPETLAAACWMLACLCWRAGQVAPSPPGPGEASPRFPRERGSLTILSGALFCAAILLTPRMLVLVGWFAILGVSWRRIGLLLLGMTLFFIADIGLNGTSLNYLWFAAYYSAVLQKVGRIEGFPWLNNIPVALALMAASWAGIYRQSAPPWRRACWLHLGYFLLTVIAGVASSWPHAYLQNFIPAYLSISCSQALLASQVNWEKARVSRICLCLMLACLCVATGVVTLVGFHRYGTIFDEVRVRRRVLSYLDSTDTVLLSYLRHPITARDACYYGPWLCSSPNRMAEAVAAVQGRFDLPRCDYLEALRSQAPRLVDSDLDLAVAPEQVPSLQALVERSYAPLEWSRGRRPLLLLRAP